MALHESGEDYLEAVLVLRQERGISFLELMGEVEDRKSVV